MRAGGTPPFFLGHKELFYYMRRFINYIGSRRFAIVILLFTLAIILLSNLLPNFAAMSVEEVESLRTNRPALFAAARYLQVGVIARSPFFLVIPAFLFFSITICTLRRVKREGWLKPGVVAGETLFQAGFSGTPAALMRYMLGKGWKIEEAGDDKPIICSRGGQGFWGSVTFHAGMNVVLLGFALSLLTRFNASAILTDGYGMTASEAFSGKAPAGFQVTEMLMEGFRAVYEEGFPVDFSMKLALWDGEGRERRGEVKVNNPLSWRGYQFVPLRYGFSPRFVVKKGGGEILDAFVTLRVMTPDKLDSFDVPGEGMKVATQFFPDYYMEGKTPKTHSREPRNPVFFIEVTRGGKELGRGFLPMNKEVSFAGYSIELKEVRMWVMLGVSRDSGLPVVTLGFILIVAGLIIRLVWNDRHVRLFMREGVVEIGGSSRYFPAMFEEELKKLAEEIGRGIKEGQD